MKNPKYIEKLYALIFLCLGIAFVFIGLLCFVGILKPTEHSKVQNPIIMGAIFSLLGVVFCVVQTGLRAIASAKDKLCNELLANGIKTNGTVEKVYLQQFVQYGKKSPFRICYTYTHKGEFFRHKSHLLWNESEINAGDTIRVLVNDFGKSTIQL